MNDNRQRHPYYSPEEKLRLGQEAQEFRANGLSFREIVKKMGICESSLRRWITLGRSRMLPVVACQKRVDEGLCSLVSPSGYRIEGLSVDGAGSLLRELES